MTLCQPTTTTTNKPTAPPHETRIEFIAAGQKRYGLGTLRRLWSSVTNRREVPRQSVRINSAAMRRYMQHYERRVDELANELASGRLEPLHWQLAMEREIAQLHLTADVIGSGGLQNVTREELDRVNARVSYQTRYLRNWREQMENGDFPIDNARRTRNRAMTYAQNADVTLNRAALRLRGLFELPAVPKDGSTQCLYNCYCSWRIVEIDESAGDFDAYWIMDPVRDNCPDCARRAQEWNPLRIRGGRIDR